VQNTTVELRPLCHPSASCNAHNWMVQGGAKGFPFMVYTFIYIYTYKFIHVHGVCIKHMYVPKVYIRFLHASNYDPDFSE
jgi:hypothetical protein